MRQGLYHVFKRSLIAADRFIPGIDARLETMDRLFQAHAGGASHLFFELFHLELPRNAPNYLTA